MMKLCSHGHRGGTIMNQTEAKLKTAEGYILQRTNLLGNGGITIVVDCIITFAKEVSK